jgi:hypothetical protein
VIPTFRTIVLCGRALSLAEQGPVRYSGFELVHPACRKGEKHRTGSLVFWIWVPPEKRQSFRRQSLVGDIVDHEKARLATGELIEVRRNYRTPIDLPLDAMTRWLWPKYLEEAIRQVNFVPEQVVRKAALSLTAGAQQQEQERGRVVL